MNLTIMNPSIDVCTQLLFIYKVKEVLSAVRNNRGMWVFEVIV